MKELHICNDGDVGIITIAGIVRFITNCPNIRVLAICWQFSPKQTYNVCTSISNVLREQNRQYVLQIIVDIPDNEPPLNPQMILECLPWIHFKHTIVSHLHGDVGMSDTGEF